ncbi:MAG: adenine phosphoribosyltransferase [Candidatus Eisenbacteria bacterium]
MDPTLPDRLRRAIRDVPDFPKQGILFRDITTLLARPELVDEALGALWEPFTGGVDLVAGVESRGFILGATIAALHRLPFVPLRKPGKLPAAVWRESYALEYGSDALEMHQDAIAQGQRVLVIDDLLATGGTAAAAARLVEHANGLVVGIATLAELTFLNGRSRLGSYHVHTLVRYDD